MLTEQQALKDQLELKEQTDHRVRQEIRVQQVLKVLLERTVQTVLMEQRDRKDQSD